MAPNEQKLQFVRMTMSSGRADYTQASLLLRLRLRICVSAAAAAAAGLMLSEGTWKEFEKVTKEDKSFTMETTTETMCWWHRGDEHDQRRE